MNEQKTRKVLEINEDGIHVVCIKTEADKVNPYKLYKVWWDQGWHRKELTRYGEFKSVLWHIAQLTIPYTTLWLNYRDIS